MLTPDGPQLRTTWTYDGKEYRAVVSVNEDKLADLIETAIGRHDHRHVVGGGAFVVEVAEVEPACELFATTAGETR